MRKFAAITMALCLGASALSGCANTGAATSAAATAENPMILTLAHGLSETHTVHIAMTEFADKVNDWLLIMNPIIHLDFPIFLIIRKTFTMLWILSRCGISSCLLRTTVL